LLMAEFTQPTKFIIGAAGNVKPRDLKYVSNPSRRIRLEIIKGKQTARRKRDTLF